MAHYSVIVIHFYTSRLDKGWHCRLTDDNRWSLTIGLVAHAQDNFWCSVVACNHIRCHQEACGSRPSQAEVQDLQCTIWLYNYVTGLEVL